MTKLAAAAALALAAVQAASPPPLPFGFTNVAQEAGLAAVTVFGGKDENRYLLETTGCGAGFIDYDNDGNLDVFLVNGSTLAGFPKGEEPINHLYHNRGDGTFTDVTQSSGLGASGWGQGVCAGDIDNDGYEDLFVTYFGRNRLYRNKGNGTFEDITAASGTRAPVDRWSTGCAFFDYDRDGRLDLIVANYIDLDLKTAPVPESGLCRYKGIPVACGPPGLRGGKNILYHNLGGRRFEDVSERSGITKANGTYGLGAVSFDFDDDGWSDAYVANDSNPSALYRNNHDGTFTDVGVSAGCGYSQDGKPQAGMGLAIGDYDHDGAMDIVKTNFAGDTTSLYRNTGRGSCEDRTFAAGLGRNTRWLGWGAGFLDLDNDSWLDLFLANGHVYPEVHKLATEAAYKQRKIVYRNLQNGRFEDISEALGAAITEPKAARGTAFGDFNNDGAVDVLVNNVHDTPDLYRLRADPSNHWITLRLVGKRSNRDAIGARVTLTTGELRLVDEVRGAGSYISQNDLRVHFGLGKAQRVERVSVRWPAGGEESWTGLKVDGFVELVEGTGQKPQ